MGGGRSWRARKKKNGRHLDPIPTITVTSRALEILAGNTTIGKTYTPTQLIPCTEAFSIFLVNERDLELIPSPEWTENFTIYSDELLCCQVWRGKVWGIHFRFQWRLRQIRRVSNRPKLVYIMMPKTTIGNVSVVITFQYKYEYWVLVLTPQSGQLTHARYFSLEIFRYLHVW